MANRVPKIKHVKSRSGCKSCKEKRLKCDETEPACSNCLNRRLVCPGYQQVYKWPSKHQTNTQDFVVKSRKRFRAAPQVYETQGQFSRIISPNAQRPDEHESGHAPDQSSTAVAETIPRDPTPENTTTESVVEPRDTFNGADIDDTLVGELRMNQASTLPMFELSLMMDLELFSRPLNCSSSNSATATFELPSSPLTDVIASPKFSDWLVFEESSLKAPSATKRRAVRGLLQQFYGQRTTVPSSVIQQDSRLVGYYFANVSAIYSCFDSHLNPFRSLVGQRWAHSASMYYTIQSMAAAHVANHSPPMRKIGIELHHKASQHLSQELSQCYSRYPDGDHALLVLLLIGLSSSWHRPNDLGLPFLRTARSLMNTHPMEPIQQVFEEAMVYWELLISFVADDTDIDVMHLDAFDQGDQPQPRHASPTVIDNDLASRPTEISTTVEFDIDEIQPHPWTGISPESQILLAQVGRLARRVRLQDQPFRAMLEAQYLPTALDLERSLLSLEFPPTDSFHAASLAAPIATSNSSSSSSSISNNFTPRISSSDPSTHPDHFITLALATRDSGLLELYRTFPELLRRRLSLSNPNPNLNLTATTQQQQQQQHNNKPPFIPSPSPSPSPSSSPSTFLNTLALQIISLIASIPPTSSITFHLLLPLVIAAPSLRLSSSSFSSSTTTTTITGDSRILHARNLTHTRLTQLADRLPAAPVRVLVRLVGEVWRRVDARTGGDDDGEEGEVCWMRVMRDGGMVTVMG